MNKFDKWSNFLPPEELATYAKGKFGEKVGFGKRAALLNIDTTYMFVDPSYPQCGDGDPELVENITRLVTVFRGLDLPIYYSRRDDRSHPIRRGMWNDKLGIAGDMIYSRDPRADEWPDAYAPREQDVIVHKNKASCFFATPLEAFLRYDEIDTIVICGISTSGCVRAAANDAFSHNFRVIVAEEAVGDRSQTAHRANLFDMDMKMADVEPLEHIIKELHQRYASADTV
ncbi:MAG: isochorismatase family protein [Rhodospirillaceae bacterium]|jgi:maleamate amidohydrolase|nr:isochorismatase family protein [Rhodospirillaceae bacterium]